MIADVIGDFNKLRRNLGMAQPPLQKLWGSLSLPPRFKPDPGLFRTFGVDLSTSPGCSCRRSSPCVGPVGIEPTLTRCKSSGRTTISSRFQVEILFNVDNWNPLKRATSSDHLQGKT